MKNWEKEFYERFQYWDLTSERDIEEVISFIKQIKNEDHDRLFKQIAGERLLEHNFNMTYNMGLEKAMEIIKNDNKT